MPLSTISPELQKRSAFWGGFLRRRRNHAGRGWCHPGGGLRMVRPAALVLSLSLFLAGAARAQDPHLLDHWDDIPLPGTGPPPTTAPAVSPAPDPNVRPTWLRPEYLLWH